MTSNQLAPTKAMLPGCSCSSRKPFHVFFLLLVVIHSFAAGQLLPQNCRISWVLTLNSYTIGGYGDSSSTTTDQCLNGCLRDLSCTGIQVHHLLADAVECWRFYSDSFSLSSSLIAGYDQYTLQSRCFNGTVCSVKWQYWENTKFQASGYQYPGITNVPACLATCLQTVGCIGVDVKTSVYPIQCFIHFNSSAIGNVLFTQEYDQYLLLDPCAVSSNTSTTTIGPTNAANYCWNETTGQQYYGLTQVPATTVEACKAYCFSLSQCQVANYDGTTSPPCWVQTEAEQLNPGNVYPNPNVISYYLNRNCITSSSTATTTTTRTISIGTSSICWIERQRLRYFNLNQAPFNTVQGCQNYCQNVLPDCTIINFDPSTNPQCWVKDFPGPVVEGDFETHPTITTYQLNRNCASNTATMSQLRTLSMSPKQRTGCWKSFPYVQYDGLQSVNQYSVVSCQSYCQSLLACSIMNFDVRSSPPCQVQMYPGTYTFNPSPNVVAYLFDETCSNSTTTTTTSTATTSTTTISGTGTDVCFTIRTQTQYFGLSPASANTERACKDYCISLPYCTIMDFVFRGSGTLCWVQDAPMTIDETNFNPNNDINDYRLNRTCVDILKSTQCSPVWNQFLHNISIGGTKQSYTNLDSCKAGCLADVNCLAIDFDASYSECYNHYDATNLLTLYFSDTASQYKLQRNAQCSTATTTTKFPTPSNCVWTIIERKNSINGVSQATYTSLDLCQRGCIADLKCLAIDYDTSANPMCWFHYNAADIIDLYDNPNSNQYILTRNPGCSGPISCWVEIPFKISIYGVLMATYRTLDECKRACMSTTGCVAIDYDTVGNQNCWFHSNPADLQNLYDSNTASQYRLIVDPVCLGYSSPSTSTTTTGAMTRSCVTDIYSNTNTPGGALVSGISNSMDCWSYCLSTLSCVGVDYDPQSGCWQHNDYNYFVKNRKLNQSPGVTQYVISRNCNNVTDATRTTITTASSGRKSCVIRIYYNTNSVGGSLVMGISTNSGCQDFCLQIPTCVGVDFDPQSGCWQHNDRIAFDSNRRIGQAPNITQYVVSYDCTTGPSSPSTASTSMSTISVLPPTCAGSFQILFNTSSVGANNEDKITNNVACLMFCLDNPNACSAIDYDTNTGCWIHLDKMQVLSYRRYPSVGVTQFVIERSCNIPLPFCSYQVLKNTYSVNGLFMTEIRGFTQCLYYCLLTPSCVAIDFSDSGSCAAHSNIVYVTQNRRLAQGMNQFLVNRVNCQLVVAPPLPTLNPLSSSTSSSTTTATTTTTTTVPYVPGCANWVRYDKTFSFGGVEQPQLLDLNACLSGCARNPNCYAVDVETPVIKCFFHLDPNFASNSYSGVPTQYRIDRTCIGTNTSIPGQCLNWTAKFSTNSINGLHYFQFTTASACQTLCVNLPSCVAVDFNTQSFTPDFGCWVHKSLQDLLPENTFASEGTNQFILSRDCQGTCYYSWTPYPNSNMVGGIPQRDTTLDGCQARCISIPECTGIDIDSRPGNQYCWLHTSTNLYLFPSTSVDHYQLRRSPYCPETKTTTSAPTTTTITRTTFAGCNVMMLLSMNSDGGQKLPDRMTKEECASRCISLYPQCVAADWREADAACFIHNSLAGRTFSTCCTRYEIVCSLSQDVLTCQDDFVVNQYTMPLLQSLLYQPLITTLDQCKTSCLNYGQSCVAVVLSAVGRISPGITSCYLVTSLSALNTAQPSNDFDLYVRRFCQPNLSVLLSTTPFPTPSPGYCLLDIVFLVDVSGSIMDNQSPGVNSMQLVRSFITSFLTTNDVGYNFDHVGIVTFDTTARIVYDLCDLQTISAIGSGVSKIVQSLGTTNTPSGFDVVYDMLFNPTRCARSYPVRPVIILITDAQTSPEFQSFYQDSLRKLVNTGVTRIALGITTDVNYSELRQFVSPELSQGLYLLDSYSQLSYYQNLVYNLITSQCGRAPRYASDNNPLPPIVISDTGSTSTSTTTTTTATSSTTISVPFVNSQPIAFGVYLSSSVQGPMDLVRYDQLLAGTQLGYRTDTSGFYSRGGLFFFDLGAGIDPGRRVSLSLTIGNMEVKIFDWQSTSFNGRITASTVIVLYLDPGQFVGVRLNYDSYLTSDYNSRYSSFSGFDISGALSSYSNSYAMVAEPNLPVYPYFGTNTTLPLVSKVSSLAGNIINGYSYVCPTTGNYLFTISMGVVGDQKTRLGLIGLNPSIEISSLSSNRGGVTTLSRSALLFCSQGYSVSFKLISGAIADKNLTSFSAIPLQNSGQGQNNAWAVYKSYNSDTLSGYPLDPFYFDVIGVNPLNLYDTNNNVVRIVLSGYYYVQLTAGVQISSQLNMRVMVSSGSSSSSLFYLTSQATSNDGEEFLSHGLVTRLNSGDTLKVVADVPSFVYNTEQGQQTSFIGFYLYP